MATNLIITGLPRSGTTLLTALINQCDNAVALTEPFWQFRWMKGNMHLPASAQVEWLAQDFQNIREQILRGDPVQDYRDRHGNIVTNVYREHHDSREIAKGLLQNVPVKYEVKNADFTLAVKHTSPFLSILDALCASDQFKVAVIMRDPVGVIASWRSIPDHPLHRGEMPGALSYWEETKKILEDNLLDLLTKQVLIYDAACKKIWENKEKISLIKYEDLVSKPFLCLSRISLSSHIAQDFKIGIRDNSFYQQDTEAIREKLYQHGRYFSHFY